MSKTYGGRNDIGSGHMGSIWLGSGLLEELPVQSDDSSGMLPAAPIQSV